MRRGDPETVRIRKVELDQKARGRAASRRKHGSSPGSRRHRSGRFGASAVQPFRPFRPFRAAVGGFDGFGGLDRFDSGIRRSVRTDHGEGSGRPPGPFDGPTAVRYADGRLRYSAVKDLTMPVSNLSVYVPNCPDSGNSLLPALLVTQARFGGRGPTDPRRDLKLERVRARVNGSRADGVVLVHEHGGGAVSPPERVPEGRTWPSSRSDSELTRRQTHARCHKRQVGRGATVVALAATACGAAVTAAGQERRARSTTTASQGGEVG